MSFVQLTAVNLAFGAKDILLNVNLLLNDSSRTAIAGGNGSGKSSLLKIISGEITPDSGAVNPGPDCRIAYLPQWGITHSERTLYSEAESAWDYLNPLLKEKVDTEQKLGAVSEGDPETEKLLKKQHDIQEHLENCGYYSRKEQIEYILQGLGFTRSDFERSCSEFSGGWQMRIALAKVLISQADILLLDEPTNYLDIEARSWLEDFIKAFRGGIAVVSHDRYFLDTTVNETIELWNGTLMRYKGNYSDYEKRRREELSSLVSLFEKQQKEISKAEDFINRFRSNASKASLVQSRVNYLERLDRIEIPENFKKIHFHFPDPPHSGKDVLTIRNLEKKYGNHTVFSGIDLDAGIGEKIAVCGINGAGKTTLLRIIAGKDEDYSGTVKTGKDVKTGYFAQDSLSQVNPANSVIDEIEESAPTSLIPQLRDILGGFLFRGDDIFKPVSVLSGGEISRICLIKLLLRERNLLILDEPTNHLDIHSKDILLDALKNYPGTLIFVSHDRYFIENTADKVLEIENGKSSVFPGDYEYYLWKKNNICSVLPDNPAKLPEEQKTDKHLHEQLKKLRSERQKLERREEQILEEIDQKETDRNSLNEELAKEENYSDPVKAHQLQRKISRINEELEKLNKDWHDAASELEKLTVAE